MKNDDLPLKSPRPRRLLVLILLPRLKHMAVQAVHRPRGRWAHLALGPRHLGPLQVQIRIGPEELLGLHVGPRPGGLQRCEERAAVDLGKSAEGRSLSRVLMHF